MNYCQDCGAANPIDANSCRICGHVLQIARSGAACPICREATIADAAFCSSCGAALRLDNDVVLAESMAVSQRAKATVGVDREIAAKAGTSVLDVGDGLELPDWLKRAAAEEPYDPSQQAEIPNNPFGPLGDQTALLAEDETDTASKPMAAGQPLSVPDGNLDAMMPAWLRDQAGQTDAKPAVTPRRDEAIDTSSFISENDLPDWIRQLGAAEAAKRVEEARVASEAAQSVRPVATTGQSRLLPGETAVSAPSTNPWLARKERQSTPDAVAADTWAAKTPVAPSVPSTPTASTASTAPSETAEAAVETVEQPVFADTVGRVAPVVEGPSPAAVPLAGNRWRLYLLAAIAAAIIVLIAIFLLG